MNDVRVRHIVGWDDDEPTWWAETMSGSAVIASARSREELMGELRALLPSGFTAHYREESKER